MLKARLVLDDCRFSLAKLAQAEERQEYRVMFLATVALCRAVGDVLDKVDKKQCPSVEVLINHQWEMIKAAEKDEKHIFWKFIKKERDTIMHTYQQNYDDGPMDIWTVDDFNSIEDIYSYAMKQGPFKGVDSKELLRQAIEWWEAQLSEIERSLAEAVSKGTP